MREIRSPYPIRPLIELIDATRPITYGILKPGPNQVNGIPYIRVVDIQDGRVLHEQVRKTTKKISDEYKRSLLQYGDLLLSIRGHVGRTAFVPPELEGANITQDTARLALSSCCEPRFIRWYVESPIARSWMKERIRGVAVKGINLGDVKLLPIPLPPLEEQRRIAAILDKADEVRRKRQEAIRLTEELLRSVFLEMFGDPVTNPKGWRTVLFGHVIVKGPSNGLYRPSDDYGSGTPIIRIDSFYDGSLLAQNGFKRVRIPEHIIEGFEAIEDEILINRVNSKKFLGKSALVPRLDERTVYESNMMLIGVDPHMIDPYFLVRQMQHPFIKNQILTLSRDAVNQSSINQSDVKSLEIRVPPLKLQLQFRRIANQLEITNGQIEHVLKEDNNLFNSLVQRAFRGELTGGRPALSPKDLTPQPPLHLRGEGERLRTSPPSPLSDAERGSRKGHSAHVPPFPHREGGTGGLGPEKVASPSSPPPGSAHASPAPSASGGGEKKAPNRRGRPAPLSTRDGEGLGVRSLPLPFTAADELVGLVRRALLGLGPISRDLAVREIEGRAPAGVEGEAVEEALDRAIEEGEIEQPYQDQVWATLRDPKAFRPEHFDLCLRETFLDLDLEGQPDDADVAIRQAAEWARDNLGIEFKRLFQKGVLYQGLKAALEKMSGMSGGSGE